MVPSGTGCGISRSPKLIVAATGKQGGALVKKELMAVILVGGIGTRLRPLTNRVPKPLIKIRGEPFLSRLLEKIAATGLKKCLLLTGYKHGMVKIYCKNGQKWGLRISYSKEHMPLGTGGALLNAKGKIKTTALVMNGDTYSDFDTEKFLKFHRKRRALATIFAMKGSLKAKGAIKADRSGRVVHFSEKQKSGIGIFNSGAYLVEPQAIGILQRKLWAKGKRKFSLEEEGFPVLMAAKRLYAYKGEGRFLDIGTFESLSKAGKFGFKKRC